MVLFDFGKIDLIVLLNQSALKTSFLLDHQENLNTMKQEDLEMLSVKLIIAMNCQIPLSIFIQKN